MPTYVTLINWTDQGIKNFKDTVDRYDAAQEEFQKLGVSFTQVYWTVGSYDIVGVVESPDSEALAASLLKVAAGGNIRTTTLRAFSRDEMRGIIERAG